MKLTKWFPPDVKPTIIGWYETRTSGNIKGKSYWNKKIWSGTYFNDYAKINIKSLNYDGAIQKKTWRGLAENPEKS